MFTCRGRLRQLTSRSDWSAGSTVHVRGGQWSPETLLVAAAVDCFVLTFRAIAAASKLPWERLSCNGEGTLDRVDGVTRFTALALT
jgi:organic hydroperoxide reductase OsmC/OhrA